MRPTAAIACAVLGLILATIGVALVYIPAACIVLGVALTTLGLLGIDVDRPPKDKP